eukprot:13588342-Ditylum_brightwellii.AAC.1
MGIAREQPVKWQFLINGPSGKEINYWLNTSTIGNSLDIQIQNTCTIIAGRTLANHQMKKGAGRTPATNQVKR